MCGRWRDGDIAAPCPFCEDGAASGERCPWCREGLIECSGARSVEAYLGEDPADVLEAARMILLSRERPWSPTEWGEQAPAWAQAQRLMVGYACERVEECLEREREKMRRENARFQT